MVTASFVGIVSNHPAEVVQMNDPGSADLQSTATDPAIDGDTRSENKNGFRIFEVVIPENDDLMQDYRQITGELQRMNTDDDLGNAGPAWYQTPSIENGKLTFKNPGTRGSTIGNDSLLVILINFTDSASDTNHNPDTHDNDYFNDSVFFNGSSGANTMRNYYSEVSYHKYNLSGLIIANSSSTNGWYTASKKEEYYGKYEYGGGGAGYGDAGELVDEAVALADDDINFSKYDSDNDGYVDHIMIVHAGIDEVLSGKSNNIWSHRGYEYSMTNDGVAVGYYTMCAEVSPLGIYSHEYGHDLGLPDLYNTVNSTDKPVHYWCTMARGLYNTYNSVNYPAHLTSWCKEELGWHSPVVVSEANQNQGNKTIMATSSPANTMTSYKVNLPGSNQWFYVENRYKNTSSYDAGLPDSGIVIWHFDDDIANNDGTIKMLVPENANASRVLLNDAAYAKEDYQTQFSSDTTPDSRYNNGTKSNITIDWINVSGPVMNVRILVASDISPPGAPVITKVEDVPNDNGHVIRITWQNSSDDGGGDDDVLKYILYMNDTGQGKNGAKHQVMVIPANDSATYSVTISNLADTVTYHFGIIAEDGPNKSPWSNNVSGYAVDNIAAPPTDLTAGDTSLDDGGNITLSWTLSVDDSLDITGYNVSINDTGQGAGGGKHIIATLSPGQSSYRVQNLTDGVTYYFNVSAFDEVYNLGYSNEASAQPMDNIVKSVTDLKAEPSGWSTNDIFNITWNNPYDSSGIVGVYYKLDSVPISSTDGTYVPGADIETLNNIKVVGNGSHPIYIWLSDGSGNRGWPNWQMTYLKYDSRAPDAPQSLQSTPASWTNTNSFDLSWVNPSDNSFISGATYKLDAAPTDNYDGTFLGKDNITSISSLAVADDLSTHPVWVWLSDGLNNTNYLNSSMITLKYDATSPGAPSNLQVSPDNWTNLDSFDITWQNPADLSGIGGAYYKLDSVPSGSTDGTFVPGPGLTGINDIKVTTDGEHTIYVWLADNATNSNHNNRASIKVYFDGTAPEQPKSLFALPSSWTNASKFSFIWINPVDISGIGGVFYKIGNAPVSDYDGIYVAGAEITSLNDIPVTIDGILTVYIWLNDTLGNSNYQNNNTVQIKRDTIAPGKPQNVLVSPSGWSNMNGFDIQWNNPAELSGIKGVYYKFGTPPSTGSDGIFISGGDINQLSNILAPGNGENSIYLWLVDTVGNTNHMNSNTSVLKFDDVPPAAPDSVSANPEAWTNIDSFDINWNNSADTSGIAGAYYRLDAAPVSDTDGTFVAGDNLTKIMNIKVGTQGAHPVYVWLVDSAGNIDYNNRTKVMLYLDFTPPAKPQSLTVQPAGWAKQNEFLVSWQNPLDLSGINGVYYKYDLAPSTNEDGSYVQGYNISNISVDNDLDGIRWVYIWLKDRAGNVNYKNQASILIRRDTTAPAAPDNLKTSPQGWTNKNNFNISWDNPADLSGIYGAYYKLGNPPASNDDGKLVSVTGPTGNLTRLNDITVTGNGEHDLYVWLLDRTQNVDYKNHAVVKLKFDNIKPGAPASLALNPPGWSSSNFYTLSWENPGDMSGISGAYYKLGVPPTSNGDGIFVAGDNLKSIKGVNTSVPGLKSLYVWLVDGAGNSDHLSNSTVKLYFDDQTPSIVHTKVEAAMRNLPVSLNAVITDEHSNVKAAYIFYRAKSDPIYYAVQMSHKGNSYSGQIPAQRVYEDWISYYLMALDYSDPPNIIYFGSSGETRTNQTTATDIDIHVTDEDLAPPTITHEKVSIWTAGESLTISALVEDGASGLSEITLYYRKSDEVAYKAKAMLKSYVHHTATIEADMVTLTGVSYYIRAVDNSPNKNTAYFGADGQSQTEPDRDSDIDVKISSSDTTAPKIIYGPAVDNLSANSAEIVWLTDEPADSRIEWGFSEIYMDMAYDGIYTTEHRLTLSDLSVGTLYYFRVSSTDKLGNGPTYSQGSSFATLELGKIDTDSDGLIDDIDPDDDNDGIDDEWEIKYNFDPKNPEDAEYDVDYDGYSNLVEFFSGTDPWNPTSNPSGKADTVPPVIVHVPIARAIKGDPLTISATVTDKESGVKEVYLFYRVAGAANYSRWDMGKSSPYEAVIPAEITADADIVEYYIMAKDFGGNIAYYGKSGESSVLPDEDTDIDVFLKSRLVEDDDNIFESLGKPFGIESAGLCILIIVLLIIALVGIGFVINRAQKKRDDEEEREREAEHRRRIEQRRREDEARRRAMYQMDVYPPPVPGRRQHIMPQKEAEEQLPETPLAELKPPESTEAVEELIDDEAEDTVISDDEVESHAETEEDIDIYEDEIEDETAVEAGTDIVDFSEEDLNGLEDETEPEMGEDFEDEDDEEDEEDIDKLFDE